MSHIRFCEKDKQFTLDERCPTCKGQTVLPQPPKYSPDDPYASYRRKVKAKDLEERGLI